MGDLGSIFVLALGAMLNPTLLAATTVMMLLPETKKLMLGYLLGAYLTSISLGMLIVFSLHESGAVGSAKTTLSPAEDIVFGLLLVVVGVVLRSAGFERRRERRQERAAGEPKRESLPVRLLGRGSARITFVVGAALTLPGASYLVALNKIAKLDAPVLPTALTVVAFCVIQLAFLELPLIGYATRPEWTEGAVKAFRDWLSRRGLQVGARVAIVLGLLLWVRAAIELITQ